MTYTLKLYVDGRFIEEHDFKDDAVMCQLIATLKERHGLNGKNYEFYKSRTVRLSYSSILYRKIKELLKNSRYANSQLHNRNRQLKNGR